MSVPSRWLRSRSSDAAATATAPVLALALARACTARRANTVIELNPHALSAEKARALLRKLRDLNLNAGPVAVKRDLAVFLGGCLSLDFPAETGVRYRVRTTDGREGLLELLWGARGLELNSFGPQPFAPRGNLRIAMREDRQGRAFATELGARVRPETTDRRELEHFLRRVVRTVFRG